jgi:hypothetical protein
MITQARCSKAWTPQARLTLFPKHSTPLSIPLAVYYLGMLNDLFLDENNTEGKNDHIENWLFSAFPIKIFQ